ncbi:MAG: PAS domain-containing protein [Candidatus Eremiobacteraeota bacterium]|nr:PAS domain-containing protein [Candidatus Eremiobacteraeota bacterium]
MRFYELGARAGRHKPDHVSHAMGLRRKLLGLIGGLLVAVLSGCLLLLFRDASQRISGDFERSLATAASTFRTSEERSFDHLEVLARSLEESPGFRNVFRWGDQPTLADSVLAMREGLGVDLMVVVGPEGKVQLRSDDPERLGDDLRERFRYSLEGYAAARYWELDGQLYRVITVPVTSGSNYVGGGLALGQALDQEWVERLASDTQTEVILAGETALYSTFPDAPRPGAGPKKGQAEFDFRVGQADFQGLQLALAGPLRLVVARDRSQALASLHHTARNFGLLGLAALVIAMLVSLPLVGRMANPVEQLEKTKLQMQTVFRGNLDGLVALDQDGQVTMSNPAAAFALGVSTAEMEGRKLAELLPAQVADELLAGQQQPGRLVQRAWWERRGHRFELARTFLRSHHSELGSILLTRDVTSQHNTRASLERLAGQLADHLDQPGTRDNLLLLTGRLEEPVLEPMELEPLVKELADRDRIDLTVSTQARVRADARWLRLALDNLLDNALRYSDQAATLSLTVDGGRAVIDLLSGGSTIEATLQPQLLSPAYPKEGSSPDSGPGLGLAAVAVVLKAHRGRLEYTPVHQGNRFALSLPLVEDET